MVFFGKDIEFNICILIIFVDGVELLVFVFFREVKFFFGFIFEFNNLVFFVVNINLVFIFLFLMFWDMGC